MTPQEIVTEIQKLPTAQKKEIIDLISGESQKQKPQVTEEEFLQMLYAEGIIGNIPNFDDYTDEDDDFEPIDFKGKPTSEIIIEERG